MEPRGGEPLPIVCIVDDEESVRRALSRLIESLGLRAELYASPDEFLERLPSAPVLCLLLDVHLPGMDGFELRERAMEVGIDSPVIFITAHADRRTRIRVAHSDAAAFLEKPFDDRSLVEALETARLAPRRSPPVSGGDARRPGDPLDSGSEASPHPPLVRDYDLGERPLRQGSGRGAPERARIRRRLRPRSDPESPGP